jgi:predicted Rossmann fold nucleotide-binding protein DprA/Smf involved in DNA uptake
LPLGQNASESAIIALLHAGVRDGDELQQRSDLPPSDFSQSLTMLEIAGTVRSLGGNQWTLR